jgi:hypothetical protein
VSNHERIYEGTLNWPLYLQLGGYTCRAPVGKPLPPWGLTGEDGPLPADKCGFSFSLSDFITLGELVEAVEAHIARHHIGPDPA